MERPTRNNNSVNVVGRPVSASISTEVRTKIEAANARIFDQEAGSRLSRNLEHFQMEPRDWKKIDDKCPPSDAYVYALQRLGNVSGKNILDFGCGDGYLSIILAKRGARVWAFDISHLSAQVAKRRVAANRTQNTVQIVRASAFALPFRDKSFDHVIGVAILHHVWFAFGDISREIFRVLRPSGTAIFQEAFGNSGFLRVIRRYVPVQSGADPETGQRQLRYSDFNVLLEVFDDVQVKEFQIFSRLDRILKSRRMIRVLRVIDEWLLVKVPWLGHFARMVVVELRRRPYCHSRVGEKLHP